MWHETHLHVWHDLFDLFAGVTSYHCHYYCMYVAHMYKYIYTYIIHAGPINTIAASNKDRVELHVSAMRC